MRTGTRRSPGHPCLQNQGQGCAAGVGAVSLPGPSIPHGPLPREDLRPGTPPTRVGPTPVPSPGLHHSTARRGRRGFPAPEGRGGRGGSSFWEDRAGGRGCRAPGRAAAAEESPEEVIWGTGLTSGPDSGLGQPLPARAAGSRLGTGCGRPRQPRRVGAGPRTEPCLGSPACAAGAGADWE